MADDIAAYEKLGAFYLGRPYDAARGETAPEPLLYDSRDLLTHAGHRLEGGPGNWTWIPPPP